jgi:hypothetical protein
VDNNDQIGKRDECPLCKNQLRVMDESGEFRVCSCVKKRQLKVYAPRMVEAIEAMDAAFVRFVDNFFSQFGDGRKIHRMVLNLESKLSPDQVSVICLFWLLWMHVGEPCYRPFLEVKVSEIIEIHFGRHSRITNISDLEHDYPILIIRCGWDDIWYDHYEAILRSVLGAVSNKKAKVLFLVEDKTYLCPSWEKLFTEYNYAEAKLFYIRTVAGEPVGQQVEGQQPSVEPAAKPTPWKASNFKADC